MEEELGILVLPIRPGRGTIVKRLRLDDELVQVAACEVALHVEQLTGWSGLLDGVRFETPRRHGVPGRGEARGGSSDGEPRALDLRLGAVLLAIVESTRK